MNISDCIDKVVINETKDNAMFSHSLEESQLICALANLLYKNKSVKKTIEDIEKITKS